ncbi:MAG: signal peptidase I [Oscillospiraceae bacterium]|nr:signal peptidase I [Oscillospiraceae bacterium]
MEMKSLNELNLEFQTETDITDITSDPQVQTPEACELLKPIKPVLITIEPQVTEETIETDIIKSIDELNLEFQIEAEIITKPLMTSDGEINKEINLEEIFQQTPDTRKKDKKAKKKRRGIFALISDMLFYMAIFTVLVAILTSAPVNGNGSAKMFMGYSYFTVLTPSMQDEIPKGSFILVKQADPQELNIGDNITFMKDTNTSVTHKIIDIYENYQDSGVRGFQTKGVNNINPDRDIVYESNIVGKVILVIPVAGAAISYIRENIYIVFIIFGLCILLSFLLRGLFGKPFKSSSSTSVGSGESFDIEEFDRIDRPERNKPGKIPEEI